MSRVKRDKIYCADFETKSMKQYLIEKRVRVYLWEMTSLEGNYKRCGLSIDEFFKELEKLPNRSVMYYHNLSKFDGEFILWYLLENGYKRSDTCNKQSPSKTFSDLTTDLYAHLVITVKLPNDIIIEFRCSYKLLPISIAAWGKALHLKKLSEKHNYDEIKNYTDMKRVPREERRYLNRDVEILRKILIEARKMGLKEITLSTSAYRRWQETMYYFSQSLKKPKDEGINEMINKSYKGGITKVREDLAGKYIADFYSYDVNSLYPSVMYNNPMPYGEPKRFKTVEDAIKENYPIILLKIYVQEAHVRSGKQAIVGLSSGFTMTMSYNYDNEFADRHMCVWLPELERIETNYDIIYTLSEIVGFRAKRDIFKKYCDHWFQVKTTAPNEVIRTIAKLMLNSLYGHFGMNAERVSKMPVGVKDGQIEYATFQTTGRYYYKAIASYITSLARCRLIDGINAVGEDFIYCDTDSIYCFNGDHSLDIDPKRIGAFKAEGHYLFGKFLKAKCYIKTLDNKKKELETRVAGFDKDAQKLLNYDNLCDGTKFTKQKKAVKRVTGGALVTMTDFTIHV